MIHFKFSYY